MDGENNLDIAFDAFRLIHVNVDMNLQSYLVVGTV